MTGAAATSATKHLLPRCPLPCRPQATTLLAPGRYPAGPRPLPCRPQATTLLASGHYPAGPRPLPCRP